MPDRKNAMDLLRSSGRFRWVWPAGEDTTPENYGHIVTVRTLEGHADFLGWHALPGLGDVISFHPGMPSLTVLNVEPTTPQPSGKREVTLTVLNNVSEAVETHLLTSETDLRDILIDEAPKAHLPTLRALAKAHSTPTQQPDTPAQTTNPSEADSTLGQELRDFASDYGLSSDFDAILVRHGIEPRHHTVRGEVRITVALDITADNVPGHLLLGEHLDRHRLEEAFITSLPSGPWTLPSIPGVTIRRVSETEQTTITEDDN